MRLQAILAETGRPGAPGVSLLNAGMFALSAQELPPEFEGWSLPQHAVALFIEAEAGELNQPFTVMLELLDDSGDLAYLMPGPKVNPECPAARLTQQVVVRPAPGVPMGMPGYVPVLVDIGAGSLWIAGPSRRYSWRVTAGDLEESVGFWAAEPQPVTQVGWSVAPK